MLKPQGELFENTNTMAIPDHFARSFTLSRFLTPPSKRQKPSRAITWHRPSRILSKKTCSTISCSSVAYACLNKKRSQHCGNFTENHGSFSAVLNMDLFEGRKEWHVGVGPTPSWDAAFVILSVTGFVALLMWFFWFNWSRCDLFLLWGEEGRKDHKAKLHSESSDFLPSFHFQNSLLLLVSPLLLLLLLLISELPLLGLLWLLLLAATIIISCQWRPKRNPSKSGSQLFGIYGGAIGYKRFDFLVDHSYLIHPSDRDAGHLVRYLSIYSLHDALQLCSRTQLIEPRSGWTLTHMISSFGHGNI